MLHLSLPRIDNGRVILGSEFIALLIVPISSRWYCKFVPGISLTQCVSLTFPSRQTSRPKRTRQLSNESGKDGARRDCLLWIEHCFILPQLPMDGKHQANSDMSPQLLWKWIATTLW